MSPRQRLAARALAVVAVVEAATWLGLLVGMVLKHVARTTEAGVELFGPLHGAAFTAYLVVVAVAARSLRWDLRTTVAGVAASLPPLGTVVFERWAARTGRLAPAR